jgi:hypothetical protein
MKDLVITFSWRLDFPLVVGLGMFLVGEMNAMV